MGFLAGIASIAAGLGATFMGPRHQHAASTGWALAAGGLVLAAIALGVMGILRLARAAEAFSEAGAYDVDTTGPQLLAASYLVHGVATLLALGGVLSLSSDLVRASYWIEILASLLGLLGYILTGLMIIRLHSYASELGAEGLDIAGVLWIISLLPLIGYLAGMAAAYMLYQAGRDLEYRLASPQ